MINMRKNHLRKPLSVALAFIILAVLLPLRPTTVLAAPSDVNDYAGLAAALAANETEINFTVDEITLTTALAIENDVKFTSTAPQGYTVLIAMAGTRHFTVTGLTTGITVDFSGTMSGSPGSLSFDRNGGVVLDGQDSGGGIFYSGGAMAVTGRQLRLVGAEIRNCSATNGGALSVNTIGSINSIRSAPLIVEDSLFESNTATNDGGAIFCHANSGSIFLNGAVQSGVTNYFYNSKFVGNTASCGGAIRGYLDGNVGNTYRSLIYTEACEFRGNEARSSGGAISMYSLFQLFVEGSAFHDNVAPCSADYLIAGQPLNGKQAPVIAKPYNVEYDSSILTRLNRYVGYVMAYGYQSVRNTFRSSEYSLHYADNGDQHSTWETDKDNWNIYYGRQAQYSGNPNQQQIIGAILDSEKYTHLYNNADIGYLNVLFIRYNRNYGNDASDMESVIDDGWMLDQAKGKWTSSGLGWPTRPIPNVANAGYWPGSPLKTTFWDVFDYSTTPREYTPMRTLGDRALSDDWLAEDAPDEGVQFVGWSLKPDAYVPAQLDNMPTIVKGGIYEVYAWWACEEEIETFTVTYDGNGNTAGTAPVDVGGDAPNDSNTYADESTTVVLDKGDLAKTNHTFIGWALSQSSAISGAVDYVAGDTITITEDITLWAVWRENDTYTVAYNPGSHGSWNVSDSGYTFTGLYLGEETPAEPVLKPGDANWTFTGWDLTVTATVTGDVIYVAQWEYVEPTTTTTSETTASETTTDGESSTTTSETTTVGDSSTTTSETSETSETTTVAFDSTTTTPKTTIDGDKTPNILPPATGENTDLPLLLSLFFVGAIILCIAIRRRSRFSQQHLEE